ncbi:MAG: bifunctional oligoribonuclease/PAP phosphatase NrnA [Spirochaetia bacterium]|nr:bifunctional oligoribonuclease/PAP phosphatase NrnA [Spirochaetia bacterium]
MTGSIDLLLKRLLGEEKFLLTTHRTPDPDGLGAELGLLHFLKSKGKDALIMNSEPVPVKMRFLDPENQASDMKSLKDRAIIDGRLIVCVDNSDLKRIDDLQAYVREDQSNLVIIDHHDGMHADNQVMFAFPTTGSSCEIVYELMTLGGVEPTEPVARSLYAGIVSDTGNFKYKKTNSRTHEIAAHLMRFGINPAEVAERLFENSPLARLLLKKKLYAGMVIEQGRLAYFKIRKSDVIELGLSLDDLDGVVNELIESDDIQAGILFTEREAQQTKVSVRSRGSISMLASVVKYGGGGHKNACGATIPMDLETAIADFIPEALRCLDSV